MTCWVDLFDFYSDNLIWVSYDLFDMERSKIKSEIEHEIVTLKLNRKTVMLKRKLYINPCVCPSHINQSTLGQIFEGNQGTVLVIRLFHQLESTVLIACQKSTIVIRYVWVFTQLATLPSHGIYSTCHLLSHTFQIHGFDLTISSVENDL